MQENSGASASRDHREVGPGQVSSSQSDVSPQASGLYSARLRETRAAYASPQPELLVGLPRTNDSFIADRCRTSGCLFLRRQGRAAARGCSSERYGCLARNRHCAGRDIAFLIRGLARHLPGSVRRQSDNRGIDSKLTRNRFWEYVGSARRRLSGYEVRQWPQGLRSRGRYFQILTVRLRSRYDRQCECWNREPFSDWL